MFSQSGSDYGKHFILSADELRPKKLIKRKSCITPLLSAKMV